MLGCRSGFQRLVINTSPKAIGTHCMIHRQVLTTKTLPQEFRDIMKNVVSVVNSVKTSASNSRPFSKLCRKAHSVSLITWYSIQFLQSKAHSVSLITWYSIQFLQSKAHSVSLITWYSIQFLQSKAHSVSLITWYSIQFLQSKAHSVSLITWYSIQFLQSRVHSVSLITWYSIQFLPVESSLSFIDNLV